MLDINIEKTGQSIINFELDPSHNEKVKLEKTEKKYVIYFGGRNKENEIK